MGFQLSPSVNVSEIDLTGFIPAVATTGGAFVGQFQWGAVEEYTIIQNKKLLERTFGKPNDVNYRDWFSCANFLDYSNNINVVRVVDSLVAKNATVDGTGILIKNETNHSQTLGTPLGDAAVIAAKYPSDLGNSLQVIYIDAGTWGTDPAYKTYEDLFDAAPSTSDYISQIGGENDEMHIVVLDKGGLFTGVPYSVLETFAFVSKARDARQLDGENSFYGTVLNTKSEYVWYMDDPDSAQYAVGGEISAVSVDTAGLDYTVAPSVTIIGEGSGATATAVLASTGHAIAVTINDAGTGYTTGDILTLANGIVVTVDEETAGVIDLISVTTDVTTLTADELAVAATGSVNNDATFDVEVGFALESITVDTGGQDYIVGTTTVTVTDSVLSVSVAAGADFDADWNTAGNGSLYKSLSAIYDVTLSGGVNSATIDENELIAGWDMFQNSDVVDVSLLILGDAGEGSTPTTHKAVIKHVVDNIANVRKDCIAFFSPKHADVVNVGEVAALANIVETREDINTVSSYAFMDSGWKYQYDVFNDKYRWMPLNADIAGICAATDLSRDPWWSPAGFTRGQIKNVIKLAFNPNKGSRDELYKRSINPVVSFVGEGVLLYGDRTQQTKPSAFQKLNIRRLFIVLEKAIATAAKYQLFEFNDTFTRNSFVNQVEPYLRDVQGRRGITDFRVVCNDTNNTGEVIDRSEFVADIYIKPANSINFIQLNFVAVRTGVDFEEVVGKF